ncbi:MAG: hypothetical protein KGM43_03655 [Planctomycetota bacterium]|nr:hypothetical protein [Planctomycetota bacterium]
MQNVYRSRGIKPIATLGNARIFAADDVARVAFALRDIDARRESVDVGLATASARPTKNAPAIGVAEASSVIVHHVDR